MKKILTFFVATLCCVACSDTLSITGEQTNPTNTVDTTLYKTYPAYIAASTNEKLNATTPQTRALNFVMEQDNNIGIVPKVKNTAKQVKSIVALYNAQAGTTLTEAQWDVVDDNEAGKNLVLRRLSIPARINLKSGGDWYMMGIIGGGNIENNTVQYAAPKEGMPLLAGNETEIEVPFTTPWRKLTVNNATSETNIELAEPSNKLVFTCQAIFLTTNLSNYMTLDARIGRTIAIESNRYSTAGKYDFSALQRLSVSDGADLSTQLWQNTAPEINATRNNADYAAANNHIFRSDFTLKRDGNKDGSSFDGKHGTDFSSYVYLNKRNGQNPTTQSAHYVITLMPFTQTVQTPDRGYDSQTFIYGDAEVTEDGRTVYTNPTNQSGVEELVQNEPNKWKPRLGNRYLLASIRDADMKLESNTAYRLSLRLFRPTLPIEHIYPMICAFNTNNIPFYKVPDKEAHYIYEYDHGAPYYLLPSRWRNPRVTELVPFMRLPLRSLTSTYNRTDYSDYQNEMNNKEAHEVVKPYWRAIYNYDGFFQWHGSRPHYVRLNNRGYNMGHLYASYDQQNPRNPKQVYAIMYIATDPTNVSQEAGGQLDKTLAPYRTQNYKVAVRFTRDFVDESIGVKSPCMKIETYYLGPNFPEYEKYNWVDVSYVCHPSFWEETIDKAAIITRYIPMTTTQLPNGMDYNYYLLTDEATSRESHTSKIRMTNYGTYNDADIATEENYGSVIPWLIQDNAW